MNDNNYNDAFAMFGDDDSDNDDINSPNVASEAMGISRLLVNAANRRLQGVVSTNQTDSNHEVSDIAARNGGHIRNLKQHRLQLPWEPPLYLGPVVLVESLSSYGGGRGYVASNDLLPGTLILVEEPLVAWPGQREIDFGPKLLHPIFLSDRAQFVITSMDHFHPTKDSVDRDKVDDKYGEEQILDMMKQLYHNFKDDVVLQECVDEAKKRNLTTCAGSLVGVQDCIRLLLAIQYNSLESGIYLHTAMLNHDDQPNCVKFAPALGRTYSEVRTTRHVLAGEPLTISYVPRLVSHATRRKHLMEQHRFDIGSDPGPVLRRMELVGGDLPKSAIRKWNEDNPTRRIEVATSELRELHDDAEDGALGEDHIKGLEQASLELCRQAEEQLKNKQHLLLIPCLELHLDCCDLVQRHITLNSRQRCSLLARVVESARSLVRLQHLLYGPDHFALARSNLDLSQAIEELLSKAPNELMALGDEYLQNIAAWATLAHKAKTEHQRIKALYPFDADERIQLSANT